MGKAQKTAARQQRIRTGAPRQMKMGTIASPWRYDNNVQFCSTAAQGGREPPMLL
jgi:hypothetical protein